MSAKKQKKAVIRADGSVRIGSGHIMRCLTLAAALSNEDVACSFVCRELTGQLADLIQSQGHGLHLLPGGEKKYQPDEKEPLHAHWLGAPYAQDAQQTLGFVQAPVDWLIVDHYAIDYRWHRLVRPAASNLMVIDDLADRALDCQLLLDQTYGRTVKEYDRHLQGSCTTLLGSDYALLRPEFSQYRLKALANRSRSRQAVRVLIFFGGMDPDNVAGRFLELFGSAPASVLKGVAVDVVLSRAAPHATTVARSADAFPGEVHIHHDTARMVDLMLAADIAVGGGGTASWERCCLGLPAILFPVAQNQRAVVERLSRAGAALNLGEPDSTTLEEGVVQLLALLDDQNRLKEMSRAAARICDGLGIQRVLQHLLPERTDNGNSVLLRPATMQDAQDMFRWQTSPDIRRYARNPEPPSWEEHISWLGNRLADPACIFNIISVEGMPVGIVRLDQQPEAEKDTAEVSILIDPTQQGKGLALAALRLVRRLVPSFDLVAEVLAENRASRNLFIKAGYRECTPGFFLSTANI